MLNSSFVIFGLCWTVDSIVLLGEWGGWCIDAVSPGDLILGSTLDLTGVCCGVWWTCVGRLCWMHGINRVICDPIPPSWPDYVEIPHTKPYARYNFRSTHPNFYYLLVMTIAFQMETVEALMGAKIKTGTWTSFITWHQHCTNIALTLHQELIRSQTEQSTLMQHPHTSALEHPHTFALEHPPICNSQFKIWMSATFKKHCYVVRDLPRESYTKLSVHVCVCIYTYIYICV